MSRSTSWMVATCRRWPMWSTLGHVQYCGQLDLEEQARIIAHAVGGRGPNTEYLYNTAAHLTELGIADEELNWLAQRVRSLKGG